MDENVDNSVSLHLRLLWIVRHQVDLPTLPMLGQLQQMEMRQMRQREYQQKFM